jgi:hypothetical protein
MTPGRPAGTRIGMCQCGRRVTGTTGSRVECPDCHRHVRIGPSSRRTPVFLEAPRRRKR